MVNNAGINRDGMLHKMPVENWQLVIDVDLTGAFFGTQEAIKYMRQKGYGRVINISSGSWLGNIGQANYAAAKAGVVGLTKTAARENARKGITCNAICPGFIETDMTLKLKEVNDGAAWESMMQRIPMGYAGKAADVGNMVAFLASDEASYITSEVINGNRTVYTFSKMKNSFYEMLCDTATKYPDKIGIVDNWNREYTYQKFLVMVNQLAAYMKHILKVEKGNHIGLLLNNGIEFATAIYAVCKLGAVAVPLPTKYREPEIQSLVKKADLKFIFVSEDYKVWTSFYTECGIKVILTENEKTEY